MHIFPCMTLLLTYWNPTDIKGLVRAHTASQDLCWTGTPPPSFPAQHSIYFLDLIQSCPQFWPHIQTSLSLDHQHTVGMLQAQLVLLRRADGRCICIQFTKRKAKETLDMLSLGCDLPFLWGHIQASWNIYIPRSREPITSLWWSQLKAMKNGSYWALVYMSHQKHQYQESTFDAYWMEAKDLS
jgi:hypothetical protein